MGLMETSALGAGFLGAGAGPHDGRQIYAEDHGRRGHEVEGHEHGRIEGVGEITLTIGDAE